ncbi:MAG: DUF2959 family protein [Phycisphaerales bacterium]|nr:DUF2959 family protein [Phycisphaerales bacterium]
MRVLLLVPLVLMCFAASCTQDAAWTVEPPRGDRLGAVARAINLTVEAQEAAAQKAIEALAAAGVTQGDAGEILAGARREVQRLRTRAQLAGRRLEHSRLTGDMLFEQWGEEIGAYTDGALAKEASRQRSLVRTRFDAAIEALDHADEAFNPILRLLDDRLLSLQHAIAANVEPPAPLWTEVIAGDLLARTHAARDVCEEFVKQVPEASRPARR